MYTRSALKHSRQFPSPPRSCSPQSPSALFAFSPLGVHFHSPRAPADSTLRSRQSHCSSSILCFQTPPHSFFFCIPPNSCPLSQLRTLREKHRGASTGRRSQATGHSPLSPFAHLPFTSHNSRITDHVRCRPADIPGVTNLPRWAYN